MKESSKMVVPRKDSKRAKTKPWINEDTLDNYGDDPQDRIVRLAIIPQWKVHWCVVGVKVAFVLWMELRVTARSHGTVNELSNVEVIWHPSFCSSQT